MTYKTPFWARCIRAVTNCLPYGPRWDYIFSLPYFYRAHGRFPRRDSGLFSDYYFYLKNSPEIMDVLRQYTTDKVHSKHFIEREMGEEYVPRTLAILHNAQEITHFIAPEDCVLKPAHSSALTVKLSAGKSVSANDAKRLVSSLSKNIYYDLTRERNYQFLKPRIIVEEDLGKGKDIADYKVFYYQGRPTMVQVDSDRYNGHKRNMYTADWQPIHAEHNFPLADWIERPAQLDKMLEITSYFGQFFHESVRVDFFITEEGRLYIGELTHCHGNAHERFGSLHEEQMISDVLFGRV